MLAQHRLLCSDLVLTELPRAVDRIGVGPSDPVLMSTLRRLSLITLSRALLRAAGRVEPAGLRTVDAIHLCSALRVRGHLDAVVAYDERLLDAARHHGLVVRSPGVGTG